MIAINTLDAMAYGMNAGSNDLLVPMIDARRMEVYSAVYDQQKNRLSEPQAIVVDENYYSTFRDKQKLLLGGDGADKCRELFKTDLGMEIQEGFMPQAEFMAGLSEQKFKNSEFENVALFEPFYLKEFVAGPKKQTF